MHACRWRPLLRTWVRYIMLRNLQAPHIRLATYKVNVTADSAKVSISNDGHGDALFRFRGRCAADDAASGGSGSGSGGGDPSSRSAATPAGGMPPWLCVSPIRGVVPAGGSVEIQVRLLLGVRALWLEVPCALPARFCALRW